MMLVTPLLLGTLGKMTLSVADVPTYKITQIERKDIFIGKRGNRVIERWEVSGSGAKQWIDILPYTSNVVATPRYRIGDEIKFKESNLKGLIFIGSVRLASR
jgi:hypothetical protein